MQPNNLIMAIGLMSGTSMDGIDAALIRTDGVCTIEEIAAISLPYTKEFQLLLKTTEALIYQHEGNLQKASQNASYSLTEVFAQSLQLHYQAVIALLQQANFKPLQIDVVGYHGQTFYHNPAKKMTIQVGDGKVLSHKVGIRVVNNFRSNDISHGGQGAPFAPIYHQALAIRDNLLPCVVVNCGGIANLSLIAGTKTTDIIGYDAGPGNCLLDNFVKQRTHNHENCDRNGKYGINGKVNPDILALLIQKSYIKSGINYFTLAPPKSLDTHDFHLIPELQRLSLEDGCATLAAFTANTIVTSCDFTNPAVKNWILAGGGWNNPVILDQLKYYLLQHNATTKLHTAADVGWDGQALEGQLVAFLAARRLFELPISFPGTTQVPHPLLGGDIHNVGTAASNCLV